MSALLIRFRPTGPWRIGPESGSRAEVDRIFHSDTLFNALTWAMAELGNVDAWLDATVRTDQPQLAISSLFPFQEQTLYAPPPKHIWPPLSSTKIYWNAVKFAPLSIIRPLLDEETLEEDRWTVDLASECLIASHRFDRSGGGPFVVGYRAAAAVDRVTGKLGDPLETACLEFRADSGLWGIVDFQTPQAADTWQQLLKGAFQYLADTGLGGERSRGWGRSTVQFTSGELAELLLPPRVKPPTAQETAGHWLLSLYSPHVQDRVQWHRGHYQLATRSGRTHRGQNTQAIRLVEEGSVVVCEQKPVGSAKQVTSDGVWRSGLAVSLPVLVRSHQ
jgi:CRISPR type III-A-associated RAMP protein Csm4